MLTIQLFGVPKVLEDGQPVKISRRKSRALLYYLASTPHPVQREALLAFFWPDTPRTAALQILRTSLYGLRQELGTALKIEDDNLAVAPDVDIDVQRFTALLAVPNPDPAILQQALQLYVGDFLDDFSLPDTPQFQDWLLGQREALRRQAVRGLSYLASQFVQAREYRQATVYLERALQIDPLQEDLQRELMRLFYQSGDRPAAIRQYDVLRRLLDEQMGVPPMEETRRLYDAILADRMEAEEAARPQRLKSSIKTSSSPPALSSLAPVKSSPGAPTALLPFTGRKAQLETLRQALAAHRLGFIEGEPGIGKTRLAQELLATNNTLSLVGTAYELENSLPYQPIIEALRTLLSNPEWPSLQNSLQVPRLWLLETARLLPELDPHRNTASLEPVQNVDETRLWEGLHQFLLGVSRLHPLILFLDDLQWADASSLALLGYLVRQTPASITFMASARTPLPRSPLVTLLQTLSRAGLLERLTLERLLPDEIDAAAAILSPGNRRALTGWLQETSEGNPFVLVELVRYLRQTGILQADGSLNGGALSATPVVPQTVYGLIQSRLARLSDPARRVLDTAVAVGREFDFEVVVQAAGLSEPAALDALDELHNAGLVNPVSGVQGQPDGRLLYTFDHTLTMEVAYREVGEARHRLLHRRAAEALIQVYRGRLELVSGQIVFQFVEGNAPDRAAPFALQAARQAAGLAAWREAASFYELALSQEEEPSQQVELLKALAGCLISFGQSMQASERYHQALNLLPPDSLDADRLRLALAESLLIQARFSEIIQLVQQTRNIQAPEIARQAQFIWGTALSLEGADLAGAADHLRQARSLSSKGNPGALADIDFELGSVAAQQGDLQQAVQLYRQALEFAGQAVQASSGPDSLYTMYTNRLVLSNNNLAYHLHLLGDPSAWEYAQKGLQLAQEQGALPLQTYLFSTLGEIRLAAGDLDEAESYFCEGLALAEKLSMPERLAGLTANLGLVALQRGQRDLAIHRLSTALSQADSLGTRHLAAQIRLWIAPLLPPDEARRRLSEARLIAEESGRQRLVEEATRLEKTLHI